MFTIQQEHLYWLKILEDHAVFVRDSLGQREQRFIQISQQYVEGFQKLQALLEGIDPDLPASAPERIQFAVAATPFAEGYYRFEGHLQTLRILNQVDLQLTPTYLNGTLSENAEYLRILSFAAQGLDAPLLPLDRMLDLWLEDQLGHAVLLRNVLDPIEQEISAKTMAYINRFQAHMLTHVHLMRYKRFLPEKSPFELRYTREVAQTVQSFLEFVEKVIGSFEAQQLLSRTTLRFLQHHVPETHYFLYSLSRHVQLQ
jgi:hypothetical protein